MKHPMQSMHRMFCIFARLNHKTVNINMKTKVMMAALCAVAIQNVSAQTQYPWQDTKLPRTQRVENLLGMLTPEEKVGLMMNKSISIERLGIPPYNWWKIEIGRASCRERV